MPDTCVCGHALEDHEPDCSARFVDWSPEPCPCDWYEEDEENPDA